MPRSHESDGHPSSSGAAGPESEDDCNSPGQQPATQPDYDWEPREHTGNKALLTREDLDRHFGYGLKEAARRLGVCKTTLKRACRSEHDMRPRLKIVITIWKKLEKQYQGI